MVGKDSKGRPRKARPAVCRVLLRSVVDEGGCWIWQGYSLHGYGQINRGATEGRGLTHRVTYEALLGPVPEGLELDHTCRIPACCNPAHLEAVTHAENVRRGNGWGAGGRYWRSQTHCKRGHAFDAVNTYFDRRGRRACRACKRAWAKAARDRKRVA